MMLVIIIAAVLLLAAYSALVLLSQKIKFEQARRKRVENNLVNLQAPVYRVERMARTETTHPTQSCPRPHPEIPDLLYTCIRCGKKTSTPVFSRVWPSRTYCPDCALVVFERPESSKEGAI